MNRWLLAARTVRMPLDAAADHMLLKLRDLLTEATGTAPVLPTGPAADGSFTIDLHARVWTLDLVKRVRVHVGVARRTEPRRLVLPIRWEADPVAAAFPSFTGSLELEPTGVHACELALVGSYEPPLGPLGVAIDATMFPDVAQRTAERLVQGLADAMGRGAVAPASPRPTGLTAPLVVRDVMSAAVLTLPSSASLRTAAKLLHSQGVSGAPVVEDDGALVGVLSEGDLIVREAPALYGRAARVAGEEDRRAARTAGEACTRPAIVTSPDSTLADATRLMLDHGIGRLVVVDAGTIQGIVSRHDVLMALLRADGELAAIVEEVVTASHEPGVEVLVEGGVVELRGRATLRSSAELLAERIGAVEGVLGVDAGPLAWDSDDLAPPLDLPLL